jgi:hypothetical protein
MLAWSFGLQLSISFTTDYNEKTIVYKLVSRGIKESKISQGKTVFESAVSCFPVPTD